VAQPAERRARPGGASNAAGGPRCFRISKRPGKEPKSRRGADRAARGLGISEQFGSRRLVANLDRWHHDSVEILYIVPQHVEIRRSNVELVKFEFWRPVGYYTPRLTARLVQPYVAVTRTLKRQLRNLID
jgi:hypothetical protein